MHDLQTLPAEVTVRNLTKVFRSAGGRNVTAVSDVTLDVPAGTLVTLLGPSGCGKTTVLRMIAGFEQPTAGTIRIGDQVVNGVPPHRRGLAMVFQSYALFPHMSVFENVAYGLRMRGVPPKAVQQRVWAMMEMMRLEGYEERAPNQLSGGQQQRVALARALVVEPSVLLLDEPLSNLDAKLRVHMRDEIRSLQTRLGITTVYVTHDQQEALSLSDLIVVMNRGRIEQVGTPEEIYRAPATEFVATFIGTANFLDGRVAEWHRNTAVVEIHGRRVPVPARGPWEPGARVRVVVRPEALRLHQGSEGFSGVIRRVTFLGSAVEYLVEVSGALVTVLEAAPASIRTLSPGDRTTLTVDPASLHLLPARETEGSDRGSGMHPAAAALG